MLTGATEKSQGQEQGCGGGCLKAQVGKASLMMRSKQRPEGRGIVNYVDNICDKNVPGGGNSKYKLLQ